MAIGLEPADKEILDEGLGRGRREGPVEGAAPRPPSRPARASGELFRLRREAEERASGSKYRVDAARR